MLEKTATFKVQGSEILTCPMISSNLTGVNNTMKVITAAAIEASLEVDGDNTVFDLQAEIESHPDSLYVKCFAIKADETNDNGDFFSMEELKLSTPTFIGVPIFTNHQNTDVEKARGRVVHSWWDGDRNGIMIIARVDAEAYPQLARGIKEEYIMGTSMGCQVQHSICSICHNLAELPDQYCEHIRERKTRHISSRKQKCAYHKHGSEKECPFCGCKKGSTETYAVDEDAFEYNYGIKFIENSFVVNPACHTCGVTEIIDPAVFLAKVASIRSYMPRLIKKYADLKTGVHIVKVAANNILDAKELCKWMDNITKTLPALLQEAAQRDVICTDQSCVKLAGQQELQDLNEALELVGSVSKSMLEQKQQIDLEFLSDLVSVLAELQTVTDELTQQGYGSLPSPGDAEPAPTQDAAQAGEAMTPMNPTPGGGSKIQSGSAGDAGTVTGPQAARRLDMSKLSQNLLNRRSRALSLIPNLHKISKKAQVSPVIPATPEKKLTLNLNLPLKEVGERIDLALENARQELNNCVKASSQNPDHMNAHLLKLRTLLDAIE